LAQVRRRVEQNPVGPIRGDREGTLRSGPKARLSSSDIGTIAAIAVPLRKAAASSRPQDPDQHIDFRYEAASLAESGAAKMGCIGESSARSDQPQAETATAVEYSTAALELLTRCERID
jgi:hypothetical protein